MAAGSVSLRKALGVLKDSTTVGLAKVNSENKGLDVAIVKATNHDEVLAKEKHIRTIFDSVSSSSPRSEVAYCIHGLAKRLAKTHNWTVALKTLIVIHRALREVDSTFFEELINYSRNRGRRALNLSHFRDDSSPNAWDYSAWVRSYDLYLEERLECSHALKFDVETDHLRMKELDTQDLLEQLPALQRLLFRLLGCQPEGAAVNNSLIQYALSIVAGESVKLYVAITDGILNMIDKYFEMQQLDALKALEIYRKSVKQAERLSEFFEICRGFDFGCGQKFVRIEQPPTSFLTTMEDHVKEAPCTIMLQYTATNDDDQGIAPKEIAAPEGDLLIDHKLEVDDEEKSDPSEQSVAAEVPQITELLVLDDLIPAASELDEKNSLALAIVTTENSSDCGNSPNPICQGTGWELALVSAPSSNGDAVAESKLAGGLDMLALDSLYRDAMVRNGTDPMGSVASNRFEGGHCSQDSFHASSSSAPPTNVQMAQQQDLMWQQQQQEQQQQQQPRMMDHDPTEPSRNPFVEQTVTSHPPPSYHTSLI